MLMGVDTNARLEAAGVEVIRVPGSELGWARGGPRAMSCAVSRESLTVAAKPGAAALTVAVVADAAAPAVASLRGAAAVPAVAPVPGVATVPAIAPAPDVEAPPAAATVADLARVRAR
jgi:hypothetical protein